jgi:hypothetical protein
MSNALLIVAAERSALADRRPPRLRVNARRGGQRRAGRRPGRLAPRKLASMSEVPLRSMRLIYAAPEASPLSPAIYRVPL